MAIRIPRIDKLNKLKEIHKFTGYGQRGSILVTRALGKSRIRPSAKPYEQDHQDIIKESRQEGQKVKFEEPLRADIDKITIFDLDVKTAKVGERKYQYLELPFIPDEVNMDPSSTFKAIASPGRNNPHYHYSGSEDTLEFTVQWFAKQEDRKDVIQNCRWLEALTKADGYSEDPHRVRIMWGRNATLFDKDQWLLVHAPYKLSQFINGYKGKQGDFVSTDLLPQMAEQKLTFKRVARTNRTAKEIITNINSS